jgi:endonuclease III
MKDEEIHAVVRLLKGEVKRWKVPIITEVARQSRDPFRVLISTVLSTRTKDETTALASVRLFRLARTPQEMLRLNVEEIASAIYPVGFYKTKARNILAICRDLIDKHHSSVPDNLEDLLALKGVGRKVANLVITLVYRKKGICVDTHVHRVCNRLGYVQTRTPEQTEMALRRKLPRTYWIIFNDLLVTFGQNICRPLSPYCSRCVIRSYCDRIGVVRSR